MFHNNGSRRGNGLCADLNSRNVRLSLWLALKAVSHRCRHGSNTGGMDQQSQAKLHTVSYEEPEEEIRTRCQRMPMVVHNRWQPADEGLTRRVVRVKGRPYDGSKLRQLVANDDQGCLDFESNKSQLVIRKCEQVESETTQAYRRKEIEVGVSCGYGYKPSMDCLWTMPGVC